ncbi:SDR family NAD(P)-dependent oxidoreductase [Gordonia sp. zg691]|uniref:SDR family NAD(P)-dependent oxidoreductase n=1 Tax=Gordonia jinghuaiqii TaxID=2758710 RepID=A0A7D7LU99_9ACTN|nr:SDR family NAD(P)-dependent oxidoreductase [Gordonia jinghuaiqii]MBD0862909.1 SDR family NAD(P)-dependent oxidoreductase [Gordonia jinghuaiqii]MCR5978966.1 SDR family NAD(P)-dependent oxidoreductase [Gordonia jinghuaiqii]QMT01701.1 SDR family NAD(P)-dependent oxidoreductase [Gordonia jinghuaiqii]
MDVAGKVAIVTGGGGGIGGAIAHALVDAGARVVVTDLDGDAVTGVAESLGNSAAALSGDASDDRHIDVAVRLAESTFGPVDLYFANAGVGMGGGVDTDEAVWDLALDVNLRSHIRAARRLIPQWVERGSGYFVSTASAAGLLTQIGNAPYSVTKHAAVGFAEWLNITHGDDGVRVSCLCPMGVDTKLLRPEGDSVTQEQELMRRAVETAGAVLTPGAVAALVLEAVADERFLILPHPEVLEMYRHKGADYDRWLSGMRRYQATLR